jgi:hypothetical protein
MAAAGEEVYQLLAQVQLRCLELEADITVEEERAAKYRDILDLITGENKSGATQPEPEASRVLDAARSTLARLTFPNADSDVPVCCPSLYQPGMCAYAFMDGPQSSSGPELTVARNSSNPPTVGRNSSPGGNSSSARSSERTSQRCHLPNSPQSSTDSQPSNARMLVPRDKLKFGGMEVQEIFNRTGLRVTPLALTRAEASCANETPGIERKTFVKLFGGIKNSEWPHCSRVPGYEDFCCTTVTAQPFMPLAPGRPGLFLHLPAVIEAPQSKHEFHVFSNEQTGDSLTLHYRGKYRKIPLPQIEFTWTNLILPRIVRELMLKPHPHIMDPFLTLSIQFQERWFRRVSLGTWDDARAIRARIQLRNNIEREPSASEVQAYMRHQFTDRVTYKEVSAAYRSGKEVRQKISFLLDYRLQRAI